LLLPDATPAANFSRKRKRAIVHPVEKLSPSSETGVSKFAKTEAFSPGINADWD